jgi:hypothetical protein
MTADILSTGAPALSATSDMPETPAVSPDTALAAVAQPADQQAAVDQGKPETTDTVETAPEVVEPKTGTQAEAEVVEPVDKSNKGINERFSKITADRRAAEARADKLAEGLEKALATIADLAKVKAEPVKEVADPRPDRTAFDDPNAYDEALVQWSARIATKAATAEAEAARVSSERARQEEDQTRALTAEQERIRTEWSDKRTKAMETYPDYAEVAERDDLQITMPMAQAIAVSENGPDIAYHLGKNVKEADRIAAMVMPGQVFPQGHPQAGQPVPDYGRQMFEIGKIAATLAMARKSSVSKAPDPIKPTGSRQAATPVDPEKESGDAYYARVMAERRAGR